MFEGGSDRGLTGLEPLSGEFCAFACARALVCVCVCVCVYLGLCWVCEGES